MLKVIARIVRTHYTDPNFGKVEIQIRDVETKPTFTTTRLTKERWCVTPVVIDGVEALCGKPAVKEGVHGWLCHRHYSRPSKRLTEDEALMLLDFDNISFIIGQDLKQIEMADRFRASNKAVGDAMAVRLDIPKRWLGKEPPQG